MIANFFSKTKPINFLVLAILVFIIFMTALFSVNTEELNFYFFLRNSLFLIAVILVVFVLNFIIRKNSLSEDNSFAILFYILMWSFFPYSFTNDSVFISNFVLLFAFRRIYSLRSTIKTKEKLFDAAFFVGIASVFYLWSVAYLLLVYAAIILFRKTDWRNIFVPIIGIITPLFLSYTYLLAFDDVERFMSFWKVNYEIDLGSYSSINYIIPLVLIGLFFVISIFPTTKKSLIAKMEFKATWSLIITHIFISLILVLVAPVKNGSEFTFLFFPLSIMFANYLQLLNRYWLKEAIIYIFIITFLVIYI